MTSTNDVDLAVLQGIDPMLLRVIEKTVEERAQKIVDKHLKERDEKITQQKKMDIKTMTKEFCTTTTAHGVSRVAEANTTRSRIIWTIILVTCVTLFVYQSAILIKSYFEYPVNVDIKVVDNKKLTFPSVTVCNNNRLRKSTLRGSRHGSLLELDERTARDVADYLWEKQHVEEEVVINMESGNPDVESGPDLGSGLMSIFLSDDSLEASTECRLRSQQLCTLAQLMREPSGYHMRTEWSYFSREGWAAMIGHPCPGTEEEDTCDECYNNRVMLKHIEDIHSKINTTFCCTADSYVQLTVETFQTHMEALSPDTCANLVGLEQGEPCSASQLIAAYNAGRRFDNWGWFGMTRDVQMMLNEGCSNTSTASTCYRGVLPTNTTPQNAGMFCCSPQLCVQSGCTAKIPGCSNPLGMESGKIHDHQISASSSNDDHPPEYGRLNSITPWRFDPYYDESPRFEVDFGKMVILTGVIIQGDGETVQTYAIQHGMTSSHWLDYVDEYGEAVLFCGHVNGNGYNFQHLYHPVLTRHVAILPRFNGWNGKNLRVEFLGCGEDDCIFAPGPFLMMNTIDPSSISCRSKDCVSNVTTYRGTVRSSGNATCQDWTCPNRHFDFCLEENFCRFAPDGNSTDLVCPSVSDSGEVNLTSAPCQSIAKCPISEADDEPVFPTMHKFYQHTFAAQYCEERGKQLCSLEQLVLLNTFRDIKAKEWGWISDHGWEAMFEEDCTNATAEFCYKNLYRYRRSNAVSRVAYCCDSLFELTEETYQNHTSAENGCRDRGMQLCLPSQLMTVHDASIRRDKYPEDIAWINMADKVALLNETCGCNVGEKCLRNRIPLFEIAQSKAYKALCCEESFFLSEDTISNQWDALTLCAMGGLQACSRFQLNALYGDGVRKEGFAWFAELNGVTSLQTPCNTSDHNCEDGVTYENITSTNDTSFPVYCCKLESHPVPSNPSMPRKADETNHFIGCNSPLGMESGIIVHDQINSSSFSDQQHTPNHARLNSRSYWKMGDYDKTPWIQVDLRNSHVIPGVITQGGGDVGGYVTSFSLSFSVDGNQWQAYTDDEGTLFQTVFLGNKDGYTPNHVYFSRAVATRYIRLYPQSWKGLGGLRLEIVGCRSSSCTPRNADEESDVQFYNRHEVMCTEPECIIGRGLNYRGKQNVTRSGQPCQKWNSHDPQYHCTTPSLYPDADLTENYCRNIPDHPAKAPWCYTGERDWEYCGMERCEVGCVDLKLNSVAGENDWGEFLLSSNTDDYTDITDFSMATREEIAEMGHQKEDLILQCTFDKERCSLDDFKVTQNAKYGNCFTFNHGEDGVVRNTTKVGAEYGLKLTLSIETDEYVGLFGQDPGAKVTIHSVGSTPFPEGNAINAKPGESSFVGLKRSSIRRQPHPYGDCTSYQEKDVLYGGRYTYETCQHSCLQAALLEQCGCSDELITINSTLCSVLNNTQECCRQEVRTRHEDGNLTCDCHQSCNENSYSLWLSSSLWPSDSYVCGKLRAPSPPNLTSMTSNLSDDRNTLVQTSPSELGQLQNLLDVF
ncbi:EDIL3 [Branchiostoma lanceolatum]|uniref:EDIL3 protein n=1 Tax=Branchiostoma lanceolatum TaxID=7740 RepID=A0A8J9YRY6_BRALA|nr:EDIL3 [Branchiostoma lanceolatum]